MLIVPSCYPCLACAGCKPGQLFGFAQESDARPRWTSVYRTRGHSAYGSHRRGGASPTPAARAVWHTNKTQGAAPLAAGGTRRKASLIRGWYHFLKSMKRKQFFRKKNEKTFAALALQPGTEEAAAAALYNSADTGAGGGPGAGFTGLAFPAIDFPCVLEITQFAAGLAVVAQG